MTDFADTITHHITTAARLIDERGYNRHNDSPRHLPDHAPLSIHGALRAVAATHPVTGREWEAITGRVNSYWWDTLGMFVDGWETTNRGRDVGAEAVQHLIAAATYQS